MDKRTFELLKMAEMVKEAGFISTAKNPAKQWGIEAKKKAKKQQTPVIGTNPAAECCPSAGISTAKNPDSQFGTDAKLGKQAGLGAAAVSGGIGAGTLGTAGAIGGSGALQYLLTALAGKTDESVMAPAENPANKPTGNPAV